VALARDWLAALDEQLVCGNYAGPDPYDALTSPILRRLPSSLLRRIATQSVKRSPVDLRAMLRVRPVRMAKTLGLVAGSLAMAPWLPAASERRAALAQDLRDARNSDGGWGYEFDVEMRWGGYPAGSSNIVATAFVVDGLRKGGCDDQISSTAAGFIESQLSRGDYIAYAASSDALIHNANLLGAVTLQRLVPGHPLVRASLHTTLGAQRADGTWPYGQGPRTAWVDSFHTGYVLQALLGLEDAHPEVADSLERGIDAWLREGFSMRGPRYYLGRDDGPLDVHNIATSLSVLARLAPKRELATELLPATLASLGRLRRRDGTFSARNHGEPFCRWELAHVHRALAEVAALEKEAL